MFQRFTREAIKVIMLAQEESRRLGHNFVSTEQILLGLLGEATGIGAQALKAAGVTLRDARVEVEKAIGRGTGFVKVEIPFTAGAKHLLELSWEEAKNLGHDYVGSEHLMLAILRQENSVACKVMQELGVNFEKLEKRVIQLIGG